MTQAIKALSSPRHDTRALVRLLRAAGLLAGIQVAGTLGYYFVCDREFDLLTCAYMTIITLTSIGFSEVIPVSGHPERVIFTIALVILGLGMMLYFVSQLTAFVVDGELRDLLFYRSMQRQIDGLSNHFIIAGLGSTGRYVLEECARSGKPCLVIEHNFDLIEELLEEDSFSLGRSIPFIEGDATDDDVLLEAGLKRAVGIVFALGNDRDNLFATITARSLNPEVRIVTRGENPQSEEKFRRAGATSVIFTNVLGGLRMAAEVIRPEVTGFLDLMMRDHDEIRRIEELEIPDGSPFIGQTVREANLRQHSDALIVALYDQDEKDYTWNPGPDSVLKANSKLILLILIKDIPHIEAVLRGDE